MNTKISLIRSDSGGVEGTFRNARHHARALLRLLDYVVPKAETMGFAGWVQGNNVHLLVTRDGRRLVIRACRDQRGEYAGLVVALKTGRRTADEQRLFTVYSDERNGFSWADFIAALRAVAE